jgi:hypothetical protein
LRLIELFEAIEPELYRYPALDPLAFRRKLPAVLARHGVLMAREVFDRA